MHQQKNIINLPLLSIIVPVYNSQHYLTRCLSNLEKTIYENYQIILIDDGSTDQSGLICDEYSKKNPRFLTIHQKNKGVSDARNTGLKYALGDFISFHDSDDIISASTYAENMEILINNPNIDFVQFPTYIEETGELLSPEKEEIIKKQHIFPNIIQGGINYLLHSKIFKRELFKSFLFPNQLVAEDRRFMLFCSQNTSCCYISKRGLYTYHYHPSSLTHTKNMGLKYAITFETDWDIYKHFLFLYPQFINIHNDKIYKLLKHNLTLTQHYKEIKRSIFNCLNNYNPPLPLKYLLNKKIPLKQKTFLFLLKIFNIRLFFQIYYSILKFNKKAT